MLTRSPRIFISYRRNESSDLVGRLHDWLANRTRYSVFLDINATGGTPWLAEILKRLHDCEVLLAVIGPGWLDARDAQGGRRLDDPQDVVRVEIETALQRGVRVVPVLVHGAAMPAASDLPAPLARLADLHALPLRSDTFQFDISRLLDAIRPERKPLHMRVLASASGLLLLVAAASVARTLYKMAGNAPLVLSDAAAAVALVAIGILLLLDQWSRPVAGGLLIGVAPFALLRIWRGAVLRGIPLSESALPLVSVSAAVVLVILLLAIDPAAGLRYVRPRGDVGHTLIPLGAFACVALAVVGISLPTSPSDLGTLRFSDPLVLLAATVLALLVTFSRGMLRGAILVGWAGSATAVLAYTIWLRSYSGLVLPPVMNAHLLMSVLTVTVLVVVAVLALRGKPRTAVQ